MRRSRFSRRDGLAILLPTLGFACVGVEPFAEPASATRIEYVATLLDPAREEVHVEARITGLGDDPLALQFPTGQTFATVPEPRLAGPIRVHPPSAILVRESAFEWRLEPRGAREVDLAWTIRHDHRAQEGIVGRDEYEHPYVALDHALLAPGQLLLQPVEWPSAGVRVALEVPEGWPVHAPWPRDEAGHWLPPEKEALAADYVAVGAWRTLAVEARDARITVAFAPGQEELAGAVGPVIQGVLTAELELFEARPFERYLIVFGRPDTPGFGGSPKPGSMTLTVQPGEVDAFTRERLVHLVAHEFFHTWAASRFRSLDELRFWFEGFTDYYAYLIPAREGMQPLATFRAALEQAVAGWESNPAAHELSLADAGGPVFFEGGSAYALVYGGGLALAALWDLEIRAAAPGSTLDDLMREFTNDARWSRQGVTPRLADLEAALAAFVGEARARALTALAETTGAPDFVAAFAPHGVRVIRTVDESPSSLRANFDGTTVSALDPTGLGAQLGLRTGDAILAIDGVAVENEGAIRAAVAAAVDVLRLRIDRSGVVLELAAPLPEEIRVEIPVEAWRP